jgi:hypothetical protein
MTLRPEGVLDWASPKGAGPSTNPNSTTTLASLVNDGQLRLWRLVRTSQRSLVKLYSPGGRKKCNAPINYSKGWGIRAARSPMEASKNVRTFSAPVAPISRRKIGRSTRTKINHRREAGNCRSSATLGMTDLKKILGALGVSAADSPNPPDQSAPSAAYRNNPRTPLSIRCKSQWRRCRPRDGRCRWPSPRRRASGLPRRWSER